MHRAQARIVVTVLSAALMAIGLAACGGTPPPQTAHRAEGPPRQDTRPDAGPLLEKVLPRIEESGSVHSAVHGRMGLAGDLRTDGTVRYEQDRADVALDGQTRMTQGQSTQPVEVAVVDDVGYLKSPMLRPEPGKPWVRISAGGGDFASRLLSPALDQLQDVVDPRTALSGVEPATKIETTAPDQVGGKPATRYDLKVDTARAAKLAADPAQRARWQEAADSGTPEASYQLWVDESGMPARFTATRANPESGPISLTSTYDNWGAPSEVQAPPAERIGEFHAPAQAQPPR